MRILFIADTQWFSWEGCPVVDTVIGLGDLPLERLTSRKERNKLCVLGNHDTYEVPNGWMDLHTMHHEFGGRSWGGLHGCFPYKDTQKYAYEDQQIEQFLQKMKAVDVIVSHNSPESIHDRDDGVHNGYPALYKYIRRHTPQYVFHGHQHVNQQTQVGGTLVVGIYGACVFDLDLGKRIWTANAS